MTVPVDDEGARTRARGWRTLAALHACVADVLERALQREHGLSVSEYSVLDVLSRQDDHCLRMNRLAEALTLSRSATTRLVSRLEKQELLERCLSPDDRRGIYTELTAKGAAALEAARPVHDAALAEGLRIAAEERNLAPLVQALSTVSTESHA